MKAKLKDYLQTVFGVNWTTNLPATGFLVCSSADLIGLVPDNWRASALAFCSFMIAIGLFAAKSSNVSNSSHPTEAKVVS
jgi:hypothetical protein